MKAAYFNGIVVRIFYFVIFEFFRVAFTYCLLYTRKRLRKSECIQRYNIIVTGKRILLKHLRTSFLLYIMLNVGL